MRLAVLLSGSDFKNRRGLMNAALSRLEYLEKLSDFEIEVYSLKAEYREFHPFKPFKKEISCSDIYIEGKTIHQLLKIEYQSTSRMFRKFLGIYHKLTHRRICDWEWQKSFAKYLKEYDAISAHFNDMAITAEYAHRRFGIPYFVTWHGSDIHTIPFIDPVAKNKTICCIENAACNFFVSQALLQSSEVLTAYGNKVVLYNGVEKHFTQYDETHRAELRKQFNLSTQTKVVSFVGNLRTIKNAALLPDIFRLVQENYPAPVKFWIIGDGSERQTIENKLKLLSLDCTLWGNQPNETIPDFLNCTDVLALPSKNEGLGLVSLEALSCGAKVVGSKVGGIPEAIGEDFCIPLSNTFVQDFANKIVSVLTEDPKQVLNTCFNWEITAQKEIYFINRLTKKEESVKKNTFYRE